MIDLWNQQNHKEMPPMSFLIDFGSSQLLPSRPVLIQNRWHCLCLAETLQQAKLWKKKKKWKYVYIMMLCWDWFCPHKDSLITCQTEAKVYSRCLEVIWSDRAHPQRWRTFSRNFKCTHSGSSRTLVLFVLKWLQSTTKKKINTWTWFETGVSQSNASGKTRRVH